MQDRRKIDDAIRLPETLATAYIVAFGLCDTLQILLTRSRDDGKQGQLNSMTMGKATVLLHRTPGIWT
jgi:hypothetical protein